jgi:hypothetical protein
MPQLLGYLHFFETDRNRCGGIDGNKIPLYKNQKLYRSRVGWFNNYPFEYDL